MVDAGFTGSETTVREAVAKWCKQVNGLLVAPGRPLRVPGQSLVNALENDQRRRKLCVPVHRVNVPERAPAEDGTTAVPRLLPDAEDEV